MNGATQLKQWAADDPADPSFFGPYNTGTGSTSQKQLDLAAQVFNGAMDFFNTSRSGDSVTFPSGALPGESSDEL